MQKCTKIVKIFRNKCRVEGEGSGRKMGTSAGWGGGGLTKLSLTGGTFQSPQEKNVDFLVTINCRRLIVPIDANKVYTRIRSHLLH